jgi:hypothetical protein
VFGLYGGDGDASGTVDMDDKTAVWEILVGKSGYRMADFDLDGQVDNRDKNGIWLEGLGETSQVPE